ncbi:hypothetical protein CCY99_06075 [Helicobacter sp. 16-1353]|uniref:sugar phosphate isomerase/epimerase family protein n=1 Tax=Helicobacter sp. 16-1353 TaxID=2004996 RepID=UPI000DCBE94A|nr:sugar phosphate isomerase/epimerase [Helicobacter sp. 16-1353]RAX53157.1 hypothetical protein CCY99_06075 [Helicobacter sp. 16-1353]
MEFGLETESYHLYFQHGKMDIFDFIDKTKSLGLDGVQINIIPDLNLNPRFGTLKSNDKGYLREIATHLKHLNLYCQIDSRWLEYSLSKEDLEIAKELNADILRTYIKVENNQFNQKNIIESIAKIKKILPLLKDYNIKLAIENHEYETSDNLIEIMESINSEYVGILFDVGNSMMVKETPLESLHKLLPYIINVHFKDHIVTMNSNNEPVITGVPIGEGSIEVEQIYKILSGKLHRINIETCYPYSATIKDSKSQDLRAKKGILTKEDFMVDGFEFKGVFEIKPNPIQGICPMDYYYPHRVGEEWLEKLLILQEECVIKSVAFMKNLRRKYEN